MDDGGLVEVVEVGGDPGFEFGLGCDEDVAEHGAGHFGEEAFDEVEPGAMLGREHEREAAFGLGINPSPGLLGDVSRVVVEDQLNGALAACCTDAKSRRSSPNLV